MTRHLIRQSLSLVLSLAVASLVIFAMIEVIPGDPASYMLGLNARPETLAALRAQMGLDDPLALRYLHWLGGMATGDFGLSYTYKLPVSGLVADRLAVSLPLPTRWR
jgi:peptide/nickel transport system permease protein